MSEWRYGWPLTIISTNMVDGHSGFGWRCWAYWLDWEAGEIENARDQRSSAASRGSQFFEYET